jgi:hypothetical protein
MQTKEKIYARDLYTDLRKKFVAEQSWLVRFLLWIKAKKHNIQPGISIYKGPVFYTAFKENGEEKATARTFDKEQTITAVKDWIANNPIDQLYARFSFIDEDKRNLEKIRATITELNPETLTLPQNAVVREQLSSYGLWFRSNERSCNVHYYGYDTYPTYVFIGTIPSYSKQQGLM